VAAVGAEEVERVEKEVTLSAIDRAWSDHLSFVADLREGIHLVGLGGDDPLTRFKVRASEAFRRMQDEVEERVRNALACARTGGGRVVLSGADIKGPSSTWTYLVNDDPFRDQLGMALTGPGKTTFAIGAALFATPLFILLGIVDRFFRKRRHRSVGPGG
jgi:preprotein translocase subunit SecA